MTIERSPQPVESEDPLHRMARDFYTKAGHLREQMALLDDLAAVRAGRRCAHEGRPPLHRGGSVTLRPTLVHFPRHIVFYSWRIWRVCRMRSRGAPRILAAFGVWRRIAGRIYWLEEPNEQWAANRLVAARRMIGAGVTEVVDYRRVGKRD